MERTYIASLCLGNTFLNGKDFRVAEVFYHQRLEQLLVTRHTFKKSGNRVLIVSTQNCCQPLANCVGNLNLHEFSALVPLS